jgi:nucleotide-binding universal stress UspA family protein
MNFLVSRMQPESSIALTISGDIFNLEGSRIIMLAVGPVREEIIAEVAMLPKNILVPTDLSDCADEALDYACELAQKLDATLHLLHVIGVPALGVPELGVAVTSSVIDSLIQDNQVALDKLASARRGNTRIGEVMLRTGDARDTIDEAAREVAADLIVMGTHGRHGISRALLGSITEAVIRTAPCPVLAVRANTTSHSHERAA